MSHGDQVTQLPAGFKVIGVELAHGAIPCFEADLTGDVCLSPDTDAVFPVKVLFLVDTSDSMSVTDRQDYRTVSA